MVPKENPISETLQEYVSLLIGLYKNNGSVSCVGINFLLVSSLYMLRDPSQAIGILR